MPSMFSKPIPFVHENDQYSQKSYAMIGTRIGVRLLKNDRGGVRAQVRRLFLQFENNAPVSDDAGNPVYNTGHCLNLSLLELQLIRDHVGALIEEVQKAEAAGVDTPIISAVSANNNNGSSNNNANRIRSSYYNNSNNNRGSHPGITTQENSRTSTPLVQRQRNQQQRAYNGYRLDAPLANPWGSTTTMATQSDNEEGPSAAPPVRGMLNFSDHEKWPDLSPPRSHEIGYW